MDGRQDGGAFSLIQEISLSVGTTTLSTYSGRSFLDYRRLEATVSFGDKSYSSESMAAYFNSSGKKIVICIQTY